MLFFHFFGLSLHPQRVVRVKGTRRFPREPTAKEDKVSRREYNPVKVAQGARRKAHFEMGGSLATWRGRAAVEKDRKKESRKRACRGRVEREEWLF